MNNQLEEAATEDRLEDEAGQVSAKQVTLAEKLPTERRPKTKTETTSEVMAAELDGSPEAQRVEEADHSGDDTVGERLASSPTPKNGSTR